MDEIPFNYTASAVREFACENSRLRQALDLAGQQLVEMQRQLQSLREDRMALQSKIVTLESVIDRMIDNGWSRLQAEPNPQPRQPWDDIDGK